MFERHCDLSDHLVIVNSVLKNDTPCPISNTLSPRSQFETKPRVKCPIADAELGGQSTFNVSRNVFDLTDEFLSKGSPLWILLARIRSTRHALVLKQRSP